MDLNDRMKDLETITAELIHSNEISEKRLKVVEKVGAALVVYLTIATAAIIGLLVYNFS